MFRLDTQYLDPTSGFHVIELRDEHGAKHLVQIAIGHDRCPACGAVYPKDNLGTLDPKAIAAEVAEGLNRSSDGMMRYAKKHGLTVRGRP